MGRKRCRQVGAWRFTPTRRASDSDIAIDAPAGPSIATPADSPLVARRRLRTTRRCVPRPSRPRAQDRDDTHTFAQPENPMNGTPRRVKAFCGTSPGERGPHLARERVHRVGSSFPLKRAEVRRNPHASCERHVRTSTHRVCPRPVSRETAGPRSQQPTRPASAKPRVLVPPDGGATGSVSLVDLDPNGAEVQTRRDGTRPGARRTFVHEGRARAAERSVAASILGTRCTS